MLSGHVMRGGLPAPAQVLSADQLLEGDPGAGWVAMAIPLASS